MTSRVEAAIDAARAEGRAAFVGYLPAGFPDVATSIEAIVALAENGVDIVEIGPPYSDPVMDGPVIQEATNAALEAGFRTSDLFDVVRGVRARSDVPILVMTYWNLVIQYGVDRYSDDLVAAGGDGLITPDIAPDSASDWLAASDRTGLDRVFLAAPSSPDERLDLIVRSTTGFVYTVSTMGITGERAELDAAASALVGRLRAHGAERALVGIGISSAEQIAATAAYADGAIVGTALVRALRDGGVAGVAAKAAELAAGTQR
ncbi:tryptophan synthase subunit alpha [Microbacterium indicum]|uniref:tryptophan synthase subunit alpha n=1 Tax=Microbacterium indicum TaxID=358100 RepID=UPI00040B1E0D|nr:tryptophan synthase subunit alpha [Microbacterium indicum]